MACLLKAPQAHRKGCVVFTTPERDHVIKQSPAARKAVEGLRDRYLIGLHHNWHDYAFEYDPLFDFSMAGDGDLIEVNQRQFARIPLDACNFSPDPFLLPRSPEPFWDLLYVARAVAFKGIAEFFASVRSMYDEGHRLRVLFICAMPAEVELPGIADLRQDFERMFDAEERKRFTLLTIDWDYPFPFDLESLAFFYRNSKVFVHPAPEERRCRTAAYAWANGMPVVANEHVASILPERFHTRPFLFRVESPDQLAQAMVDAVGYQNPELADWRPVIAEFSGRESALRVDASLIEIAANAGRGQLSDLPIRPTGLDIRLGRHHQLAVGGNRLGYSVEALCNILRDAPDEHLVECLNSPDPEVALGSFLPDGDAVGIQPDRNSRESASDGATASDATPSTASEQELPLLASRGGWSMLGALKRWFGHGGGR